LSLFKLTILFSHFDQFQFFYHLFLSLTTKTFLMELFDLASLFGFG
jgi:hypothetical protein